jgi:hypothetical protein
MTRIILAVLLVVTPTLAVANPDILKMKNGVTFTHKKHQSDLNGECKNCHRKGVNSGHVEGFGKDSAHRMCRTCHSMKNAGPVSCKDCHKH